MANGISRRDVLGGTAAVIGAGWNSGSVASETQRRAAIATSNQGFMAMTTYIGTPTSRVDGRAKVTGAAKYAGEVNAPDLAYGFIVESIITKGRIASIDTSDALRVAGVFDVLTHQNRPPMSDKDEDHADDVAPEGGSPFRPLFGDVIEFNRQPVALVLADE